MSNATRPGMARLALVPGMPEPELEPGPARAQYRAWHVNVATGREWIEHWDGTAELVSRAELAQMMPCDGSDPAMCGGDPDPGTTLS